jgi:hypothetical protein
VDPELLDAERLLDVLADGTAGFSAQPPHEAWRIVAGEGRQVHQRDGPEQPGGLPFPLHRPPRRDRRRAALDGAPVDADGAHDVQVECRARVALDVLARDRPPRVGNEHRPGGLGGRTGDGVDRTLGGH